MAFVGVEPSGHDNLVRPGSGNEQDAWRRSTGSSAWSFMVLGVRHGDLCLTVSLCDAERMGKCEALCAAERVRAAVYSGPFGKRARQGLQSAESGQVWTNHVLAEWNSRTVPSDRGKLRIQPKRALTQVAFSTHNHGRAMDRGRICFVTAAQRVAAWFLGRLRTCSQQAQDGVELRSAKDQEWVRLKTWAPPTADDGNHSAKRELTCCFWRGCMSESQQRGRASRASRASSARGLRLPTLGEVGWAVTGKGWRASQTLEAGAGDGTMARSVTGGEMPLAVGQRGPLGPDPHTTRDLCWDEQGWQLPVCVATMTE
ncbi:hypothetical protein BKA66DRAFT_445049 [Pyrenochaeta sp. MPI-SDFR-AT-0127]|nr:hypothetical protein BKA66DRAFT_445049 [Pyrenochaeta sp. MPI-SDFR-AT-0127]